MAERWTLNGHKGHNLFMVTAHEIGHTLGLEHSPVRHALMSPYYRKLGRSLVLSWDDILAVQQLYGEEMVDSWSGAGFLETSLTSRMLFEGLLLQTRVVWSVLNALFVKWNMCGSEERRSVRCNTFTGHTHGYFYHFVLMVKV